MKKLLSIVAIVLLSFCANASDTTFVTLQVGAGSKFAPINLVDKVTGNYISAVITNVSVQNNNPEFATVTANQAVIKATPILPGRGTAIVSCQASYTDSGDGLQKNETKIVVVSYLVVGAPNGTKIILVF